MTRKGWRLALLLPIAVYVFAVLGSGFDRLSIAKTSYARFVMGPFRANAAHVDFSVAIVRGQLVLAVKSAREGLAVTPGEARGAGQLGVASTMAGDIRLAKEAFAVSRRLSSREPGPMLAGAAAALRERDFAEASEAIEALLRSQPNLPGLATLIAVSSRTAEGRRNLGARFAHGPEWMSSILPTAPDTVIFALAPVFSGEDIFDTSLGCDAIVPLVERLIERGRPADALLVRDTHCSVADREGQLVDADFARLANGDATSPFGWRKIARGDVSLRFKEARSGPIIEATNRASVSRALLTQPVRLEPGRYTLGLETGDAGHRLFWRLRCGKSGLVFDAMATGGAAVLEIPESCEDQEISLWVGPGAEAVTFAKVDLRSAD